MVNGVHVYSICYFMIYEAHIPDNALITFHCMISNININSYELSNKLILSACLILFEQWQI